MRVFVFRVRLNEDIELIDPRLSVNSTRFSGFIFLTRFRASCHPVTLHALNQRITANMKCLGEMV